MKKTHTDDSSGGRPVLAVRTTQENVELIRSAADFLGVSVTEFRTNAAVTKALRIIETTNKIYLAHESANEVFNALKNPPAKSTRLSAAAKRYKERTSIIRIYQR